MRARTPLWRRRRRGIGATLGAPATRGAGALRGTPSSETTGKLETPTVPYWLVKVSELPPPCCCETPPIWWSSVS